MENNEKYRPDSEIGQKDNFSPEGKILTNKKDSSLPKKGNEWREAVLKEIGEFKPKKREEKKEEKTPEKEIKKPEKKKTTLKIKKKAKIIIPRKTSPAPKKKTAPSQPAAKRALPSKKKKFPLWAKITLIFTFLLFLLYLILGSGFYIFHWQSRLYRYIPYPVAYVGGHFVFSPAFEKDYQAVAFNLQKNKQKVSPPALRQKIAHRLVDNELISLLAKKYNVQVTPAELQQATLYYQKKIGSRQKFIAFLQNNYQWDIKDFQNRLLYPVLLSRKVNEYLLNNPTFNKEQAQLAQRIWLLLKKDPTEENFQSLAKTYSQDPLTAAQGGYCGWLTPKNTDKKIWNKISLLSPREISDIIRVPSGFYIFYIIKKSDHKIEARKIFIKAKGLEQALNQERGKIKIFYFLN